MFQVVTLSKRENWTCHSVTTLFFSSFFQPTVRFLSVDIVSTQITSYAMLRYYGKRKDGKEVRKRSKRVMNRWNYRMEKDESGEIRRYEELTFRDKRGQRVQKIKGKKILTKDLLQRTK